MISARRSAESLYWLSIALRDAGGGLLEAAGRRRVRVCRRVGSFRGGCIAGTALLHSGPHPAVFALHSLGAHFTVVHCIMAHTLALLRRHRLLSGRILLRVRIRGVLRGSRCRVAQSKSQGEGYQQALLTDHVNQLTPSLGFVTSL